MSSWDKVTLLARREARRAALAAYLDAAGLRGGESVAAKNSRADGCLRGANLGAIGVDDNTERRGRSGPTGAVTKRSRNEQGEEALGNRNAFFTAGDCKTFYFVADRKTVDGCW